MLNEISESEFLETHQFIQLTVKPYRPFGLPHRIGRHAGVSAGVFSTKQLDCQHRSHLIC